MRVVNQQLNMTLIHEINSTRLDYHLDGDLYELGVGDFSIFVTHDEWETIHAKLSNMRRESSEIKKT